METPETFPCLAALFRSAACWCSAFWLFSTANTGAPLGLSFPALLAAAWASYGIFRLFLRRPRTVPAIAGLGAGLTAAEGAVLLGWFSTLSGFFPCLMALAAEGALTARAFFFVRTPIPMEKSISGWDLSLFFAIFFLTFQAGVGLSFVYSLPLLAAAAVGLLAIMAQRFSDLGSASVRGRFRGLPVVAAVTCVIAAAAALFLRFAADPVSRGAAAAGRAGLLVLKAVGHALYRVLLLLASLFPTDSASAPLPETPAISQAPQMTDVSLSPTALMILGGIALTAAAVLILFLLLRFRRVTFGGRAAAGPSGAVRRSRVSLSAWLGRLAAALRARLAFWRSAAARRGTPQFLYWRLTRKARRLGLPKRPAETPCAFLRRLGRTLPADTAPEVLESLELLERALAQALYSPTEPGAFPAARARCLRRELRALPRRRARRSEESQNA